jgi:hypothetical protein
MTEPTHDRFGLIMRRGRRWIAKRANRENDAGDEIKGLAFAMTVSAHIRA